MIEAAFLFILQRGNTDDVWVATQLLRSTKRPIFQSGPQAVGVPDEAFWCKVDQETGGIGRAEGKLVKIDR